MIFVALNSFSCRRTSQSCPTISCQDRRFALICTPVQRSEASFLQERSTFRNACISNSSKINAILFIVCVQNKIASENVRTLIALVNTCLTFLIRTTDVVNGIHCIRDAKVINLFVVVVAALVQCVSESLFNLTLTFQCPDIAVLIDWA